MPEKKKDPAEGWTHEGGGVWVPPMPSELATPEPKAHEARCSVATGLALRDWTLADERNLADRLANALLSRDPMERISALAYYAAQLADAEAQDVCRLGGVSEAALARARRVDAKLRSVPNVADEPRGALRPQSP